MLYTLAYVMIGFLIASLLVKCIMTHLDDENKVINFWLSWAFWPLIVVIGPFFIAGILVKKWVKLLSR